MDLHFHFDPEKVEKIVTSNLSGQVLKTLCVNNCYTTRQIKLSVMAKIPNDVFWIKYSGTKKGKHIDMFWVVFLVVRMGPISQ